MSRPAVGMDTWRSAAMSGNRPVITNSVIPIANVPTASAARAKPGRLITRPTLTDAAQFCHNVNKVPPRIFGPMRPVLDVVIPVYNEAADLERSVRRLRGYLLSVSPFPFRITIADNASTDDTPLIAGRLAVEMPEVTAVYLADKGRGRAL